MESEFNIKLILKALKKNVLFILLIGTLCAAIAGGIAAVTPPTYSSTAKYLSTNYMTENEFTQSALVNAQQDLVKDYIEIIKSKIALERVSEKLAQSGIVYSHTELLKMIKGDQIDDTSAFTITVSCKNKSHSKAIAESLSSVITEVVDTVQKRENTVAVLDSGSDPVKTYPSISRNTVIGFVLGAFVSTVVFALVAFYDRTLRTEDDLKKRFNLPILGVIPEWKV